MEQNCSCLTRVVNMETPLLELSLRSTMDGTEDTLTRRALFMGHILNCLFLLHMLKLFMMIMILTVSTFEKNYFHNITGGKTAFKKINYLLIVLKSRLGQNKIFLGAKPSLETTYFTH